MRWPAELVEAAHRARDAEPIDAGAHAWKNARHDADAGIASGRGRRSRHRRARGRRARRDGGLPSRPGRWPVAPRGGQGDRAARPVETLGGRRAPAEVIAQPSEARSAAVAIAVRSPRWEASTSHSSGNSPMGRGVSTSCCARAISSFALVPRDSESDTPCASQENLDAVMIPLRIHRGNRLPTTTLDLVVRGHDSEVRR